MLVPDPLPKLVQSCLCSCLYSRLHNVMGAGLEGLLQDQRNAGLDPIEAGIMMLAVAPGQTCSSPRGKFLTQ